MEPGIYSNISNADYHGGPGISNSGLSLIRRSPLHYKARTLAANDNAPTAAQAIGTAFHALMLEPELFYQTYTLGLRHSDVPDAIDSRERLIELVNEVNKGRQPKLSATGTKAELIARITDAVPAESRTDALAAELNAADVKSLKATIESLNETRHGYLNVGGTMDQIAQALRDAGMTITLWTEVKAEWNRNNGHRTVLKPEEWDQLMNMRDAVMAHPAASQLIAAPGKAEQSVYWVDQATGVLCRCRPDKWTDSDIIVDLKTTDDASPAGFSKSIANWSYDVQDAFYTDGCAAVGRPLRAFLFLAVEKTARVIDGQAFGVKVYRLGDDSRNLARAKYRRDLATFAECQRTGVWPCYGDKIEVIEVPQWMFSQNAHLLDAATA